MKVRIKQFGNSSAILASDFQFFFWGGQRLTQNRPGFLQIGKAGGGQILSPLRNFCLDGPIDLKFGM